MFVPDIGDILSEIVMVQPCIDKTNKTIHSKILWKITHLNYMIKILGKYPSGNSFQ